MLALLEQARAPLCFVEEEMARRYHNRALPLGDEEESYFQQVVTAWRKMGKAYALCASLEQPDTANPQYVTLVATILHRCLYYTGMVILEHYRARRELPPGYLARPAWLLRNGRGMGASRTRRSKMSWKVACKPRTVLLPTSPCC